MIEEKADNEETQPTIKAIQNKIHRSLGTAWNGTKPIGLTAVAPYVSLLEESPFCSLSEE